MTSQAEQSHDLGAPLESALPALGTAQHGQGNRHPQGMGTEEKEAASLANGQGWIPERRFGQDGDCLGRVKLLTVPCMGRRGAQAKRQKALECLPMPRSGEVRHGQETCHYWKRREPKQEERPRES